MPYALTSELNDRLGDGLYARLTDRDAGATASALVAQQILDEAEAVANAYLSQRYRTPIDLTAHPELTMLLRTRTLDLAEFLAWKSTPFFGDVPDRVRVTYEDALRWFETVAKGSLPLPAARILSQRTAEDDAPRYRSEARQFTRAELDGL